MGLTSAACAGSPVLKAQHLAFSFGMRPVLRDVSLDVAEGELVFLLGSNGAGKTTLLRLLLGFERPARGNVQLMQRPVHTMQRRDIARILAYLPQNHSPPFPYTVRQIVLLGRVANRGLFRAFNSRDQEIAESQLARLRLLHLVNRIYTELSGGERQLVLIARALTQGARLLIMDEPVTSLDYGNQHRVLEHLRELAADGIGILLTSHQPDHALQVATRVIALSGGCVMADGPPEQVVTPELIHRIYGICVDSPRGLRQSSEQWVTVGVARH